MNAPIRLGIAIGLWLEITGASMAQVTQEAYVGNSQGGYSTVSVIGTTRQIVINTIDLGSSPYGSQPTGAAVTPDGAYVYITDFSTGSVSVIDTGTQAVVKTIVVGTSPYGVAITPDSRRVYVVDADYNGTVSVIDTLTQTVVNTIPVGIFPTGVALTPDGLYAYVANSSGASNTVSVIDTARQAVVKTIAVGNGPFGVAAAPDDRRVYVTNTIDGTVSVIDPATQAVVKTIAVGNSPMGLAITPDGGHLYIAGLFTVSVVDTETYAVTNIVRDGHVHFGVALTPNGRYAYVTDTNENKVLVIDTAREALEKSITVGISPLALGNFVSPNLITGTFGVDDETDFARFGFGRFVNFLGGTLQLKARLNDAHILSLIAPGGTIDVNNGFNSAFSGDIVGAGTLTKAGAGMLILTGSNSYAGGTNISGGILAVNDGSNLGTGALSFHGATLECQAGGRGIALNNTIVLTGGGGIFLADAGTTSRLSGVISGADALTKDGPGTLILTGANTYSGGTNINGGTLVINSYRNLGTGPVRFHGGILKVQSSVK
jgi:YVTN family beta-propeller protein/autotransporter-associated beta strand protein